MASHVTSSSYPVVSQVVFSIVKMIHLVMSSWFIVVNVIMMNSCANVMDSDAKVANSIAKPAYSIANGMNSNE